MGSSDSQTIDTEKVKSALATWDSALATYTGVVEGNSAKNNECLKKLSDAGLDSGFIASFDKNFEALGASLEGVSSALKTAVGYIENQDNDNKNRMPGGGNRSSRGGGGGSGGDDENTTEPDTSEPDTSEPETEPGVDNMNLQIDEYKKMSMNDLQDIVDALTQAAKDNNMTLEELLGDKQNSELIKKTLLASIKSEELKKLIEEGNIEVTRELLVNIVTGKEPEIVGIDKNTVLTLSKHLENIAKENNITLTDLVDKEENATLLRKSMTNFADVVTVLKGTTSENLLETMKNVYNGNYSNESVKDVASAIGIFRDHLDSLAENYGYENSEDVIKADGYANTLATLSKFSVFTNNASAFSNENIMALISNTLKLTTSSAEGGS